MSEIICDSAKRHYKSDFDFAFGIKDKENQGEMYPPGDFYGVITTHGCSPRSFEFSSVGGALTNCLREGERIRVICASHDLPPGKLHLTLYGKYPNAIYPDGTMQLVWAGEIPIELTRGSDSDAVPDFTVNLAYVVRTAYDCAVAAGYTGSEREFMEALSGIAALSHSVSELQRSVADNAEMLVVLDALKDAFARRDTPNTFTQRQLMQSGLDVSGSLTVEGDIYQQGSRYETHAEDVKTAANTITLRDGATFPLASGELAAIYALLYNGTDTGVLGFDREGTARVGDLHGALQPLLTRPEHYDIPDGALFAWDASRLCAVPLETETVEMEATFDDESVETWQILAIKRPTTPTTNTAE